MNTTPIPRRLWPAYPNFKKGNRISPSIKARHLCTFRKFTQRVESNTVFLSIDFSDACKDISDCIDRCVRECGLQCVRVDQLEYCGSIPDQIAKQINGCRVMIADVTRSNPNVLFEIGLACQAAKDIIVICHSEAEPPFSLRHINTIRYCYLYELEPQLRKRLKAILTK